MGGTLTSRHRARHANQYSRFIRWERWDGDGFGAQARCWVLRERFLMSCMCTTGTARPRCAHRMVDQGESATWR